MSLTPPSLLPANTGLHNATQLSSFPPPKPPDIDACDDFFGNPLKPELDECLRVFDRLPAGSTLVRYRSWKLPSFETKGLFVYQAFDQSVLSMSPSKRTF